MSALRRSTPQKEGVLNVSKWIKHQVLLDKEEMRELFSELSPLFLYVVSDIVERAEMSQEEFFGHYDNYVEALKSGQLLDETKLRRYFSSVLTKDSSLLYAMEVKPERFLIKPIRPVIQMQLHHFLPSKVDGKFHPMVLSSESVTWGLQFSYPQIFQHPQYQNIEKVTDSKEFPNTAIFTKLAKCLRDKSVPTTFIWGDKKTSVPIRLGKSCFSWIKNHPQLKEKGLSVHVY